MVSCGVREIIRYLAEHKMIDAIVTTAGGIEEDFMKCYEPFKLADLHTNDFELADNAIPRTGNMLSLDETYDKFYDGLLFPTV